MEKILGEQTKFNKVLWGLLLLALTVYLIILAANALKEGKYIGRQGASINTITVSGKGEIYTSPDLATIDFSVISEAKNVSEAMEDNTKKMNAIIDVAKKLGIAENDLQTSGFNINPHYDYVTTTSQNTPTESYYYPSGKRVLSGYEVNQTLTVKIRQDNMAKIGQIIQEATNAGANEVGDLQFTVDKPDELQAKARKQAIDEAKAKAQVLADQLGVRLGNITGYSENGSRPVYSINYAKNMGADMASEVVAPTIQTGQNKIEENVSITYEIQ